jgi:transposase
LIGINVSNDTVRRLYQNIEISDNASIEGVGIDDVSIRKGMRYATVVYDMKDHSMLALLDGRDGETLKEWLKNHKKIKMVARDRATAYANAISAILPEAIQIADRFHLFQNLVDRFKEIFKREIPEDIYILDNKILDNKPNNQFVKEKVNKEILDKLDYDDTPPVDDEGNIIRFYDKSSRLNDKKHIKHAENRKKK